MMDIEQFTVLCYVVAIWLLVGAVYVYCAHREEWAPVDDIGVMWLVVFSLYSTLPSVYWVIQGGSYSLLNFYRLYTLQPSTEEIIQLLNIALGYVCSFSAVFLLIRTFVPRRHGKVHAQISQSQMLAAFTIAAIFQGAMLLIGLAGFIRTPESYLDSYLVIQELPLPAKQALKIGGGIASVAMLVLLIGILQRWPRQKHLFFLYLAFILISFDPRGARTSIAIGLLSIGIAWHLLVHPIPTRQWLAAGIIGGLVFFVLGLLRAIESFDDVGNLSTEGYGLAEFDALWANAVELLQARDVGWIELPLAARFAELWAFIPSQLLPFEKLSLSDWFLDTFYPEDKAMGGGWAFGAIGQAVIGAGVLEAVIRGGALGGLATLIMKWYRSRGTSWWCLPLYLYMLIFVYQSVRDTTFQLLGSVIQIAVPALLLIALLGELLNLRPVKSRVAVTCTDSSN